MTNNQQLTTNNKSAQIVQKDAPVLRKKAKPVLVKNITSPKIQKVISNMKRALKGQDDGVAIAAPQIGKSLRIFVVSGKVFDMNEADPAVKPLDPSGLTAGSQDLVFINPEITKISRKKQDMEEGCLSVRWLYGWVKRSEKATVRAYNEEGKRFEMGASGLMAQIFQHETDHLDGILFIDKTKNLEELPPKKPGKSNE